MYNSEYTYHTHAAAQRRKLIVLAVFLGIVLVLVAAAVWFFGTHVVVDSQIYSRTEDVLDLRGEGVAVEHYEALHKKMPDKLIYWDVPFQDGYYANNSTELTMDRISEEETELLGYFYDLKTSHYNKMIIHRGMLYGEAPRYERTGGKNNEKLTMCS